MLDKKTTTLIIIGIAAGVISGSTGLAAAGAILLGLTFTSVIEDRETIVGTTLYTLIFPSVIFGVYEYYKRKKIDFYAGNILVVVSFVSIFLGAYLTLYIPQKYLIVLTGILLLVSGGMFIKRGINTNE
jgi:uncharacterized protein